jgi:hypothetical protein
MKLKEIQIIKSILSASIGWSWPVVLLKALTRKNAVFSKTRWSNTRGSESEFVKRISVAPALYIELGERIGRDKAFEVMEELLVSIGCEEQWDHLNSMDVAKGAGMKQLMAFNKLMDQKGAPRFNKREYVRQDENVCHFLITRCVFNDFFTEAGTPELTKLFCQVDRKFFPEAFPDFTFHRGDSWENTIAYGKDHCEFVFQKKST